MGVCSFLMRLKFHCKERIYYKIHRCVFVFGMPYHSNAGDQAQSYCIEQWIHQNYPKYIIRWFDAQTMYWSNYSPLKELKRLVKKKDLILLHSGYHTTDLYLLEEELQRKVIQSFPKHRIVILPQTVNYYRKDEEKKSMYIYNEHKDLLLFCHDSVSFEKARQIFYNCKLYLYPDIVTSMIGQRSYNFQRKGILLCLRNDKEALITNAQRRSIIAQLSEIDNVAITDTTLNIDSNKFINERACILEKLWGDYAKYRLIITDRYHGTIFSLIAATPVLVISSSDHKLESGLEWFPDSYKKYIKYVPNLSCLKEMVISIYNTNYHYNLPSFFKEKYYDKLKLVIEGE